MAEKTLFPIQKICHAYLTLCQPVLSAGNLCKQFGPRSGTTKQQAMSESECQFESRSGSTFCLTCSGPNCLQRLSADDTNR